MMAAPQTRRFGNDHEHHCGNGIMLPTVRGVAAMGLPRRLHGPASRVRGDDDRLGFGRG
jgi:hypothetical protein